MPGIFLGSLHIPSIFRATEQDFVQNHEVSGGLAPWTPILLLNIGRFLHIVVVCRRAREVHFATISIFCKSQVFFRGNYFFKCWPPCLFMLGVTPLGLSHLKTSWGGGGEFVCTYSVKFVINRRRYSHAFTQISIGSSRFSDIFGCPLPPPQCI